MIDVELDFYVFFDHELEYLLKEAGIQPPLGSPHMRHKEEANHEVSINCVASS